MRLYFLTLFCFFFLSCAEKQDNTDENHATAYASTIDIKGRTLKCNIFSDDTFFGKIKMVKDKENCVDMKISKYPDNFFETENIFLQAYPFSVREGDIEYNKSLPLLVYQNKDDALLFQSQIIDSFLIKEEIKTSAKSFFNDHYLRLCGLEEDWDGIQLVTYLRRDDYDTPNPIRITRFLLPPFLANPNHFKQKRGDALLAYHPFIKLKQKDLQIEPSSYYKISESICNSNF